MKKIWIIAMVMCILLTGCGSKKTGKKSDWKTDKILAIISVKVPGTLKKLEK